MDASDHGEYAFDCASAAPRSVLIAAVVHARREIDHEEPHSDYVLDSSKPSSIHGKDSDEEKEAAAHPTTVREVQPTGPAAV